MGQWSAKLTFHFNLALAEWEWEGGSFKSWEISTLIFRELSVCLEMSTLYLFCFQSTHRYMYISYIGGGSSFSGFSKILNEGQ